MIKQIEYAKRRKKLLQAIDPSHLVILPAANEVCRNGDSFYSYRQNSDFYYLTGFEEPEAVLVLAPNHQQGEYILFSRPRDREKEIWDGARAGQEGACKDFLVDQAYSIDEFEKRLPELLTARSTIHYPLGLYKAWDEVILKAASQLRAKIRSGTQPPLSFTDITPTLHEMRLFKSTAEITQMQTAIDITGKAHVRAMEFCKPGINEYQLEAEIFHEFQRHGARFPAYSPIVGAGRNTCVLHYVKNNQIIQDGDLVLIDAGAEYTNYAADITRTFPANGRFSAEQRAIYELVLTAQTKAIHTIKPGASWAEAQNTIVKVLTQGLIDLGILKGNLSDLMEQQAYLPFYMHNSGHWLGLDVHDAGRYKVENKWRNLEEGMVLTVEPGIYISADIPGVPARWHNIGVRIEDDVLVTKTGHRVLSHLIPKNIIDIEAVMAAG